jgi:hypothetical protein
MANAASTGLHRPHHEQHQPGHHDVERPRRDLRRRRPSSAALLASRSQPTVRIIPRPGAARHPHRSAVGTPPTGAPGSARDAEAVRVGQTGVMSGILARGDRDRLADMCEEKRQRVVGVPLDGTASRAGAMRPRTALGSCCARPIAATPRRGPRGPQSDPDRPTRSARAPSTDIGDGRAPPWTAPARLAVAGPCPVHAGLRPLMRVFPNIAHHSWPCRI